MAYFLRENVFDSSVKSSEYFSTDNIRLSLEMSVYWCLEEIVQFEIDVGFTRNVQNVTVISRQNHAKQQRQAATFYVRLTSSGR